MSTPLPKRPENTATAAAATNSTSNEANDDPNATATNTSTITRIPPMVSIYSTDMERPTNTLVTPLLTDLYQITMIYSYYQNQRHLIPSIFELFFRKNPFCGEYTIIAGVDECLKYINTFCFTTADIEYLQSIPAMSYCQPDFFHSFLLSLHTKAGSNMTIRAIPDGTVVFPRVPLLIIEAPLALGQVLETTLLSLMNYPTLITTNATRMVHAAKATSSTAGHQQQHHKNHPYDPQHRSASSSLSVSQHDGTTVPPDASSSSALLPLLPAQCYQIPQCVELGLRRAQGPDGGFSASKYSAIGGCIATSNVMAGKLCHIPVIGTHAHSYVQSYSDLTEVQSNTLRRHRGSHTNQNNNTTTTMATLRGTTSDGAVEDNTKKLDDTTDTAMDDDGNEEMLLLPLVLEYRTRMSHLYDNLYSTTNDGELAAFIAYGTSFPHSFLCLIDTYDTLKSGVLNFLLVAFVLHDLGYTPKGIRLDSGDLAYLSMECALLFQKLALLEPHRASFLQELQIVASNDINEDVLHALNKQEHAITMYGIGTNLVTCQAQPALGGVYKLVEIDHKPRIKLSQDISKVLIPGRKKVYRLTGKDGKLLLDVMLLHDEAPPKVGERFICRHPFIERKRAAVTPSQVDELHVIVYQNGHIVPNANRSYEEAIAIVPQQLAMVRSDILRYINPTPYKVSVSENLFTFLHNLWQAETPVAELS